MLAQGIAAALQQSGYVVDIAATAAEATRLLDPSIHCVGVLDLGLPDRDGIDLLREWRSAGIAFPVLILSARSDLDDRIRGLDSGADDYLVKPFALSEIEARLRALLRRQHPLAQARLGRLRFESVERRAFVDDREIELTKREFEVLDLLMGGGTPKVVRKHTLFDAVFSCDADVGPNALEVHISRLRHKLRPAGIGIRALRGLGYRIEELPVDATTA